MLQNLDQSNLQKNIREELNNDSSINTINEEENIKLDDNQISSIKKIVTTKHIKLNELGMLELNYTKAKNKIFSELHNIESEEEEIAKQLKNKYGIGSINIDNWTYVKDLEKTK